MAIVGPKSPTAASGTSWTNPTNVEANDGSYATCTLPISSDGFSFGSYLSITGFGFSIPIGAIINGIVVDAWGHADANSQVELLCQLLKAGSGSGSSKISDILTTSDEDYTLGTSSDLWGATLTYSDVNTSNFGVRIRGANQDTSTHVLSLDYVSITVYYTASGFIHSFGVIY